MLGKHTWAVHLGTHLTWQSATLQSLYIKQRCRLGHPWHAGGGQQALAMFILYTLLQLHCWAAHQGLGWPALSFLPDPPPKPGTPLPAAGRGTVTCMRCHWAVQLAGLVAVVTGHHRPQVHTTCTGCWFQQPTMQHAWPVHDCCSQSDLHRYTG